MKTIELKVSFNQRQIDLFESWTKELNWVWNAGRELLLEFHQFKYYDWIKKKAEKSDISLEDINYCYLQFPRHSAWSLPMLPNESKVDEWVEQWRKDQDNKFVDIGGAKCQIAYEKDGKYTPCSPRSLPESPRLRSSNEMGLTGYLTKGRCNEMRELKGLPLLTIPAVFIKGVLSKLAASWSAYTDKNRRHAHQPSYRDGIKRKIESLFVSQSEVIKLDKRTIRVTAEFGLIPFSNAGSARIPANAIPRSVTIKKEPSGYYICVAIASPEEVQLSQKKKLVKKTKDAETKEAIADEVKELQSVVNFTQAIKPNGKPYRQNKQAIAGIELGGAGQLWTDDLNRESKSPLYLHKSLEKLAELQRKAARQRSHMDNIGKKGEECKNLQKTYRKIAKLHERIRRQRRAFAHKECDKVLDQFKVIYLGDIDVKSMMRSPKPVPKKSGNGYEPNGRKRKSKLNRLAADIGVGQFKEMIISKAPTRSTEVIKVSSEHRLICSKCGHKSIVKRSRFKHNFVCENCGFTHSARYNAALNHKAIGLRESVGVES